MNEEQVKESVLAKDEAAYWKGWMQSIATENRINWLQNQVNNRPLDSLIEADLRDRAGLIRILDVGAGPLSVAGSVSSNPNLEIARDCSDPLGNVYTKLLNDNGISSPSYICKPAERLLDVVAPESYDYVFCRNALDHSYDCPSAIQDLITILKPGGVMRLRHYENEALYANYSGFHRWNFMETSGEGIIFSQSSCHNIRTLTHPCATLAYESMMSPKDDGTQRRMAEFVMVKPSGFSKIANTEFGICLEISSCRRLLKVTKSDGYDSTFPMFIHLHSESKKPLSTTLVWEDTTERIFPLFDSSSAASPVFSKVAMGQYDFIEGHNHYSPSFQNQWYLEFDL